MLTLRLMFKPVLSNVERWSELSVSGQELRVSHCEMKILEHYMVQLCEATNRDYSQHLFRSKRALSSKITEIFRWSLRGILGKLTPHAQSFCLPFIRDGSFRSFDEGELEFAMTDAFGTEIFRSLTDTSYNTKAQSGNKCPWATISLLHCPPLKIRFQLAGIRGSSKRFTPYL